MTRLLLVGILLVSLVALPAQAQPDDCAFPAVTSITVTDFATDAQIVLTSIDALLALQGESVDWYDWQNSAGGRLWDLMWFEIIVNNAGWSDEIHVLDDPDAALIYIYLDPSDIGGAYLLYIDSTLSDDDGLAHGCAFQRVPIQAVVDAMLR